MKPLADSELIIEMYTLKFIKIPTYQSSTNNFLYTYFYISGFQYTQLRSKKLPFLS